MLEPQNSLIPLASLPPFKLLQFNSVAQSRRTLRDPTDCSMPGLPVHQQCLEFTQTHLHWFIDAIQPAHPPSSPSPPAFNLSQHQSFLMSWLFTSGGQSLGASASVLPMNIQDWFPFRWTGWMSWQTKGLSRAFSNITVQKHQFFCIQLSLWSNSHFHTWLLEKS